MLDVHPPHEKTHTWADFFIHIATIVVGLLIAVGLEQMVERIHAHYEVRETRRALAEEREQTRRMFEQDGAEWLEAFRELRSDVVTLRYLRQHPGTRQQDLPAELDWTQSPFLYQRAVWDAAVQNGVVHLMPLDEANRHEGFYNVLRVIDQQSLESWDAINDAARYDLVDPDPTHLSPTELDDEIRLAQIALEKHFEMGYSLARVARVYPDMPQKVTYRVLNGLRPDAYALDPKGMQAAHDRLEAAVEAK